MEAITEASNKRRFKNCKLKAFVFDDGTYTSSWRKALTRFNLGETPCVIVNSKEAGQVKTSKVTGISFYHGHKFVETDKDVFEIKGTESQKKVAEVRFFVPGGSTTFSTKNTMELVRVLSLLELGCEISSEVFFKDGTSTVSGDILEIDIRKKKLVTENHTVYRW